MGIWKLIKKIFHLGAIKVENGLNQLLDAESKLQILEHDTKADLQKQKDIAEKLKVSKKKFDEQLEKAKNELTSCKTRCQVAKNKLVEAGQDPKTDDDFRFKVLALSEQQKLVDDMQKQKDENDKMMEKVDKNLRHLNLNIKTIELRANTLRQKIQLYQSRVTIDEAGMVDINATFSEVDEMVRNMQYEQEAHQEVNDIVNGREDAVTVKSMEVDNLIDSL